MALRAALKTDLKSTQIRDCPPIDIKPPFRGKCLNCRIFVFVDVEYSMGP